MGMRYTNTEVQSSLVKLDTLYVKLKTEFIIYKLITTDIQATMI